MHLQGKVKCALRSLRKFIITGVVCCFSLACVNHGLCQEVRVLRAILELPEIDDLTFDRKTVVKRCSDFLIGRDKSDNASVAKALRSRGTAYISLRDYTAAEKDFAELCKLLPHNAEARCFHAAALSYLKRSDDAMRDAVEALRIDPNLPLAYVTAAACLMNQGKTKESIAAIQKANLLDPNYPSPYYIKGVIYLEIDSVKCLEAMNKYLELSPYAPLDIPEAPYYCRGFSLSMLNRPREALSSYLMARKLNPSAVDVARELAITYADLGRFHLAAHYAEECSRLEPKAPVGYALAAKYYSKTGDTKEALRNANKAISVADRQPSILTLVGDAFFYQGKYADAFDLYKKALEIRPGHLQTSRALASFLATCPDAKYRDGPQAVKLATMAYEWKALREWQKWEPGMVLAEALAETGAFADAVRYAKQAIKIAGPEFGRREEFLQKLDSFEKEQPWRAKPRSSPAP